MDTKTIERVLNEKGKYKVNDEFTIYGECIFIGGYSVMFNEFTEVYYSPYLEACLAYVETYCKEI